MRCSLIVVAVVALMGMSAEALAVEGWAGRSRPHYYGWYGGYGYNSAFVIYDLSAAGNARRYVAQSERLLGQQIAAQQTATMQTSIRNTLEADAQRRYYDIRDQQQASRDWWLAAEQQQMAQRQARAAELAAAKAMASEGAAGSAAMDLIQWPFALRAPRFAEQRVQIEAPYRHGSKIPSTPTARDYQNMIEAAGQMKVTLKQMVRDVSAEDYLSAEAFLDQLTTEARGKIGNGSANKR